MKSIEEEKYYRAKLDKCIIPWWQLIFRQTAKKPREKPMLKVTKENIELVKMIESVKTPVWKLLIKTLLMRD